MSRISNTIDKIKNIFKRNKQNIPQLEASKIREENKRDLILEGNLDKNALDFYEVPQNYNTYCQNYFRIPQNFAKQYNYADIISQMQKNGAMEDYMHYLSYVENNSGLYFPSQVHGIDHTKRVLLFAEMLSTLDNLSAHDKNLIMVSAQLHDIGRGDDAKNFDHGRVGREKIEAYGLINHFPERDQEIIKFAVESHSLEPEQLKQALEKIPKKDRKDFERILNYVQDADKLDRARIKQNEMQVDPNRLSTETAKKLIKVSYQNFWNFNNMMDYEKARMSRDEYGDSLEDNFNAIRALGYDITFKDFQNIIDEMIPGTLDALKNENRIGDIFSYDTFCKYRKPETFDDRLKPNRIEPNKLFEEINQNFSTQLLERTFKEEFMVFYNLKKNNPQAFDMLKYVDVDYSIKCLAGIANEIQYSDLERFYAKGDYFRLDDLFILGHYIKPEEYRSIIDNNQIEDLYNIKYAKNPDDINRTRQQLQQNNITIDEKTFNENYRLIQVVATYLPEMLTKDVVEQYTIPEIFSVVTKLEYARNREEENNRVLEYDKEIALDLLADTKGLIATNSFEEQLDAVSLYAKEEKLRRNPKYIEYITKKNKPYKTNNPDEIINYKEFCIDSILVDMNIDLNEAKSKLLNTLFRLDMPNEHKDVLEKETIDRIYYYKKYLSNSKLMQDNGEVIDTIHQALESTSVAEMKNILYENKSFINQLNTEQMELQMQTEISRTTRENVVSELTNTANAIRQKEYSNVIANNGEPVNVKVLDGEKFFIATSTIMPKCSSSVKKIRENNNIPNKEQAIYDKMLKQKVVPYNFCTSIQSDEMLAHAASALPNNELLLGFVPDSPEQVSLMGKYDLATTSKNGYRTTRKVSTNRSIYDLTSETVEEHNEVNMNAYPDFIVCYDEVSEIAIRKKEELERQYSAENVNKKVDIVLIKSKENYLPKIQNAVLQEHRAIQDRLNTNKLTLNDFRLMFERKESDFVLRTIQAMNSGSYRDDTWNENFNRQVLGSCTDILERVSEIVPGEKSRIVLDKVEMLLDKANYDGTVRSCGNNFYDHTYSYDINSRRLQQIKSNLTDKAVRYEKNLPNEYGNSEQQR